MTSEILVMNKETIALAADSIVTLSPYNKTFSSANKLFALSKKAPVGIMVYSNATFMGLPWEAIIKYYRKHLDEKKFDTLNEYAEDFISFLNDNEVLNSEISSKSEDRYTKEALVIFLYHIRDLIFDEIEETINNNKTVPESEIRKIITKIIETELEKWKKGTVIPSISIKLKKDPDFEKKYIESFLIKYKNNIKDYIKKIFENLAFNEKIYDNLVELLLNWSYKDCRIHPNNYSGIVVAGFGEKEILPSVSHYFLYGKINGIVQGVLGNTRKLNNSNPDATIQAFAQKDMIFTFMEGVHPHYLEFTDETLLRILQDFSNEVIDKFKGIDPMKKNKLKNEFEKTISNSFSKYQKKLGDYRYEKFAKQTIKVVAVLPKDELAALAESLVYLTSLKRKLENEQETVGGPIDVAVITKGDGFIWIKRKHYFDPHLNPHYFNSFREV